MMQERILLLPGLGDSGPDHWQTHWEAEYGFTSVRQREWITPDAAEWVATLNTAIQSDPTPALLVGHSLACNLIVRWSMAHTGPVAGALLVAPSDVEAPVYPAGTTGFSPMPMARLPFPAIVVASSNDDYVSVERSRQFAEAWHADYVLLENRHHLGSTARLGLWPEGLALLDRLRSPLQ